MSQFGLVRQNVWGDDYRKHSELELFSWPTLRPKVVS